METSAWTAIVPVKELGVAKSRLPYTPIERAELALAMATDVVDALQNTHSIARVLVVTDDPTATDAFSGRCIVVPDEPRAGLSAALAHGARIAAERWPSDGVVAVAADIPALTAPALDAFFEALAAAPAADRPTDRFVVADAAGVGTALLGARAQVPLAPAYEGGSLAAHLTGGAYDATPLAAASLRRDVDTTDDLRAALALGAGAATLRTLAAHGLQDRSRRIPST